MIRGLKRSCCSRIGSIPSGGCKHINDRALIETFVQQYSGMADKETALCLMDPNLERTFRGHKSYITSVAFSPSLKQLASGSGDNSVMLWNFKPQLRAFKFIGHKVRFD